MTRTMQSLVWIVGAFGLAATLLCSQACTETGKIRIEETRLGPVPAGNKTLLYSTDWRHVAWIETTGTKSRVFLDCHPEAEYDQISNLTFSPNGKRLAYKAQQGRKSMVVVDGRPGPECDLITALVFNPNGTRLAYWAKTTDKWFVVVDGQPGPKYKQFSTNTKLCLIFSPNGRHLAYVAWNDIGKAFVVVDGIPGPEYDVINTGSYGYYDVPTLTFSSDSKRFAYEASNDKRTFVVVDGKPVMAYEQTVSPGFSQDSKHVLYGGRNKGISFFVVDGHPQTDFDQLVKLRVSPNGKRIACVARHANKSYAVVDGIPGPKYDVIHSLFFSPDSKRVAYVAENKGKGDSWFLVVDGKQNPDIEKGYAWIKSPIFSPDSQRIAFLAQTVVPAEDGPLTTILTKETVPIMDSYEETEWRTPIAWKGEQWAIVVDGKPGPAYDLVGAYGTFFSPDSKRLTYLAVKGNKCFIVADGKPGPEFDVEWDNIVTTPFDDAHLFAGRYRVKPEDWDFPRLDNRRLYNRRDWYVTPQFSHDSRHVAYVISFIKTFRVVVDGQTGPEYDRFPISSPISNKGIYDYDDLNDLITKNGPAFQSNGTLEYCGVRDGSLFRVKHIPQ